MDALFDMLTQFGDGSTLMVSAFVFMSAAALAFGVMAVLNVRAEVKRRAAEIGTGPANAAADDPRSLRYASKIATQRLIDYTAKHYSGENAGEVKELRRRLIQAGFLDSRAPAFFFVSRHPTVCYLLAQRLPWVTVRRVIPDGLLDTPRRRSGGHVQSGILAKLNLLQSP